MENTEIIESLDELILALDKAETQTAISDDAFREAVAKITYRPSIDQFPKDPFSPEYREKQLELYNNLTSNNYSTDKEHTPFNFGHEIGQPFPYGTRSANTVGETLIGHGHIIKDLPISPNSKILEVGSGYGTLAVHLAPMHVDLTCIDIDIRLLDFISHRISNYNHQTKFVHTDIPNYEPKGKFDVIIFHESFHHFHNHLSVINKLPSILSATGVIIFASEPIVPDICPTVPYPWGLRMDGLSLRCIRNFGWFELGFTRSYFLEMLASKNLVAHEKNIPGYHYTHIIEARPKTE
jgi:2-polyprenyl-3-methyl-5-hydroxy-6-metoxy-1,4-benzoquinol methylase